jgi:single-strand DNA-binding protein
MANLNKVLLMGNLTRDPELRYTPSGQAVCNLGLAVNRMWTDKQGQKQKDTCFLRITVWGKTGENCASYLKKGRAVFVEGRLQSRSWESEDGKKNTSIDVVAERVDFLSTGDRQGAPGGAPRGHGPEDDPGPPPPDVDGMEDDIPF